MKFITSIYSNTHLSMLGALIESIDKLYGNLSKIYVYYNNVSEDWIKKVKISYPYVETIYYDVYSGAQNTPYKSSLFNFFPNTISPTRKLSFWYKALENIKDNKIAFVDADMVVLRKIDNFIDGTFDIGYTYKTDEDENLKWLLNTGIILVNDSKKCLPFFKYWRDESDIVLNNQKDNTTAEREWGAIDQSILGKYLNISYDSNKYINKNGIIFKGFKCKNLNETRCTPIHDQLYVIHYKGSWHHVFKDKEYNRLRPENKCNHMRNLWEDLYSRFENKIK